MKMNEELVLLRKFFQSYNLPLSNIWLESCLEWCKTENLQPNYTFTDLKAKVYEQWLLLDLCDIKIAKLPPNLSSEKFLNIPGSFCLQIMKIVDISKPKLVQLQKIRNSNALTRHIQDKEGQETGKRMLLLTISDGVQEVNAMEYKPIRDLNVNIPPGSKIKLIGPLTVRRGRIMLEERHVKLLGGEVEEYAVENAAENVLAKALNMPLNPKPGKIEENELEEIHVGINQASNKLQQTSTPVTRHNIVEEVRIAQLSFSQINDVGHSTQGDTNKSLDDDFFDNIDIDAHLDEVENSRKSNPEEKMSPEFTPKTNVISLEKVLRNKNNISKGKFKIKAKFRGIVEKLTFEDDQYKMVIKIQDGMCEANVNVHSDVISIFAGLTPVEMKSFKANILENDEISKEKVVKAILNVKTNIFALDNIMELEINKNEYLPTIVKVTF